VFLRSDLVGPNSYYICQFFVDLCSVSYSRDAVALAPCSRTRYSDRRRTAAVQPRPERTVAATSGNLYHCIAAAMAAGVAATAVTDVHDRPPVTADCSLPRRLAHGNVMSCSDAITCPPLSGVRASFGEGAGARGQLQQPRSSGWVTDRDEDWMTGFCVAITDVKGPQGGAVGRDNVTTRVSIDAIAQGSKNG
jgi:hypothetical protein